MNKRARIRKIEKASTKKVYPVEVEDKPGFFRVGGVEYSSLEEVERAFPGQEVVYFRVVWDDEPPKPGDIVLHWDDGD